jgi:Na+-transporting NADH:ubiquinone oxidoreductase subunit C
MKKEGTIYTIIFIFLVSFVFVFLLSLTNQATIEQVELNQELARQQAVLSAMGIEASTPEEIQQRFANVRADSADGLFAAVVDGETVYAKEFSGSGLWGTISGFIAVNSDLSEFVGIEIVEDNETPGLGARINESWFKDQFRGEQIPAGRLEVRVLDGDGDPNKSNGIVDGVTGATRTSDSMETIVNAQIESFKSAEIQSKFRNLTEGGNA